MDNFNKIFFGNNYLMPTNFEKKNSVGYYNWRLVRTNQIHGVSPLAENKTQFLIFKTYSTEPIANFNVSWHNVSNRWLIKSECYQNTSISNNCWLFYVPGKTYLVCLSRVYRPTREFSLVWRRHQYKWRAAIFDLCSALIAFE